MHHTHIIIINIIIIIIHVFVYIRWTCAVCSPWSRSMPSSLYFPFHFIILVPPSSQSLRINETKQNKAKSFAVVLFHFHFHKQKTNYTRTTYYSTVHRNTYELHYVFLLCSGSHQKQINTKIYAVRIAAKSSTIIVQKKNPPKCR